MADVDELAVPRRRWVLPVRILASLALLAFLWTRVPRNVQWHETIPAWTGSTFAWLGAAAALTLLSIVLSALRWQQVLTVLGVGVPLRRLVNLYFAGQFVSNALPTTIGGDVVRVTRLSQDTDDRPLTFASVVLERLSGWLVLPLITLLGLAIDGRMRGLGHATTLAVLIALATLGALVLVLAMAHHDRIGGRFHSAEGWLRFIGAVHLGVTRLRARPGHALGVVAAGLVYQLVLCGAALCAARALGIAEIGPTALLAFFPAVLIAQVLPIGISGLGVREGAFIVFLGPLGVATEQAIALGLLLYVLNLGVSLLGAPSFALGGRRADPRTAMARTG